MNRETQQLLNYIDKSGFYLDKIASIRLKYSNIKDFNNMLGYVIMDIVNTERSFFNINRKNIEIELITEKYF